MTRGTVSFIASFCFWAVMMGLLVEDRFRGGARGGGPLIDVVRGMPAASSWYAISRNGRRIGYAHLSVAAEALREAVAYHVHLYLKLHLPEDVLAQAEMGLLDPGGLSAFSLQARAGTFLLALRGRPEEGGVRIDCQAGDPAARASGGKLPAGSWRIPLDRYGGPHAAVREGGEQVMSVQGVLTPVRRYLLSSPGGEAALWLDRQGVAVRLELPGGITVLREAKALAERIR